MLSFISSFFNSSSVFSFCKLLTPALKPTLNYSKRKGRKEKEKEHKIPFIFIVKSVYIYSLVDMLFRIFLFKCFVADFYLFLH